MNHSPEDRTAETRRILTKIIADFEQLDCAIEAVMKDLQAAPGLVDDDVEALQRARDAARKGALLAKSKLDSQ